MYQHLGKKYYVYTKYIINKLSLLIFPRLILASLLLITC